MHSGISPTHLEQPLTAEEAAELARLHQKVARSNQLSRLGDRLIGFHRRHYPRWLALNPLLPRCYFGDWSIPVARWPWSARPYPVSPPRFALSESESGTLDCLDARRRRPAELAQLDYDPQAPNGWINRYERRKNKTLSEQQAEQAQAVLADFEARLPESRAHLEQHYADDYHAYQRSVIGFDKMVADFRQYMAAEIASLGGADAPVHDDEEQAQLAPMQPADNSASLDFALYIKPEFRNRLLPFLKDKYTGSKPGSIARMIHALVDLSIPTINLLNCNQEQLHEALSLFLEDVGTRQGLNSALNRLSGASSDEHLQIEKHRKSINDFIEQTEG